MAVMPNIFTPSNGIKCLIPAYLDRLSLAQQPGQRFNTVSLAFA